MKRPLHPSVWPGIAAMAVAALGLLAASGYLVIMMLQELDNGSMGLLKFVLMFFAGSLFIAYLAFTAWRGNAICFLGVFGFILLTGPLICLSTQETLHWVITGILVLATGVGVPNQLKLAAQELNKTPPSAV